MFDDWTLAGIAQWVSGTPASISFSTVQGTDLTGGGDGQRVNIVGNPNSTGSTFYQWFNTAAFAVPGKGDPGNAAKNSVRNPGVNNEDLALSKRFPAEERKALLHAPLGSLQRLQPHAVFGHQHCAAIRSDHRRADQHRFRPGHLDARAAHHAGLAALHVLSRAVVRRHEGVNRIPPLALAGGLIGLLAAFSLIPWVSANPRLAGSIWAAAAALLVFLVVVRHRAARAGRVLSYTVVPKPVHYVQLTMHTSIYLYWGWYWREVYHYAPLIVAQIVFVYVLDMLVCWSRRDKWILGFGPFPIVLSTNLFLWFKDDWFFLQFLLVSTGVLCKEFITWQRDGRRTHIFNPSAIALAIFSIGLLVTHSTHLTWGEEVAVSQGRPPHIYLEIFAVGLGGTGALLCHPGHAVRRRRAVCAESGVHRLDRPVLLRRFQHPHRGLPWPALAGHRPGNLAAQELRQASVRRHVRRAGVGSLLGARTGWARRRSTTSCSACRRSICWSSRWTGRAPPWKRASVK